MYVCMYVAHVVITGLVIGYRGLKEISV